MIEFSFGQDAGHSSTGGIWWRVRVFSFDSPEYLSIADVAERIGTGPRAVMDAEKGKASTGMVVYAALLWLYDQIDQLDEVGDPSRDKDGLSLQAVKERQRARKGKGLDSDF